MNLDRIAVAIAVISGLATMVLWVSKARESDLVLSLTLKYLAEDIARLRGELVEMRSQHRESAIHTGKRISITRTILFKLINHLNTKANTDFEFVDIQELED